MTRRMPSVALFAAATLGPLALLACGALWGGGWTLAAALCMALLAGGLDQITPQSESAPDSAGMAGEAALLAALALAHLIALPLLVNAIAGAPARPLWQQAALFTGAALWFGQVAMAFAHELIHRGRRWQVRLGVLVFGSLLFGHHASAHRLVHHVHVATAADPNTARAGEGFYRFAARAWAGSFRRGWQAESARRHGRRPGAHPYAAYGALAAASLGAGWLLAGWKGALVWAGLSALAQGQLLLSDYVQHYGLRRAALPDGRLEPVSARHSWNAPHWFSGAMMLNAPRHSDHHSHPGTPYPALRLPKPGEAPMLPWPLPLACTIALAPPLWKRLIRPHLARWR